MATLPHHTLKILRRGTLLGLNVDFKTFTSIIRKILGQCKVPCNENLQKSMQAKMET